MDKLLDFNQPLDVPLLDSVVEQFYAMGSPEVRPFLVTAVLCALALL